MNFNQLKMSPQEVTRSIHKIVAFFYLAASREFSPKAIDDAPSDERTVYFDDTPDGDFEDTSKVRGIIWGNSIGHRGVR